MTFDDGEKSNTERLIQKLNICFLSDLFIKPSNYCVGQCNAQMCDFVRLCDVIGKRAKQQIM